MTPYDDRDEEETALLGLLGNDGSGAAVQGGPVVGGRLDETKAKASDAGPASPVNTRETRAALGGYAGRGNMLGFRQDDYGGDTKAANTVKNTFGRIASRYDAKPGSLDAVMNDPDFKRYFPNARKVEGGAGDKIDFGGVLSDFEGGVPVGVVDVGGAFDPANDSGAGWTWQDLANDGGGDMAGGDAAGLDLSALGGGEGGGSIEQIMAEIEALQNGQNTPMDLEALLAQLSGGA